jgi:hypothetical protein
LCLFVAILPKPPLYSTTVLPFLFSRAFLWPFRISPPRPKIDIDICTLIRYNYPRNDRPRAAGVASSSATLTVAGPPCLAGTVCKHCLANTA